MRWHWQNLNADRFGRKRSGWRHGRAWFNFGKNGYTWCVEWSFLKSTFPSLGFMLSGDDDLTLGLCFLLGALYVSYDRVPRWLRDRDVTCKLLLDSDARYEPIIEITPFGRSMEWRKTDPWYVRGIRWHPLDWLLGRTAFKGWTDVESARVIIPMPEGCYDATVTLREGTWKRPRWFVRHHVIADVQPDWPIPHEGKGENSWDCGEDGLFSLTCNAQTVEDAIGKTVATCLRDRKRYGGSWTHRDLQPVTASAADSR